MLYVSTYLIKTGALLFEMLCGPNLSLFFRPSLEVALTWLPISASQSGNYNFIMILLLLTVLGLIVES